MPHSNLLNDPYYASMIFQIEKNLIHFWDCQTSQVFRDSDVKSAIRKALTLLKGKPLKSKPKNEKEMMIFDFARALVEFVGELTDNDDPTYVVPKADYANALLAIEDSLKTRRKIHGTSRGYLDFLADFLADANAA